MALSTVYHKDPVNGKIIQISDFKVAVDRKISYPSEWFQNNSGKKLPILVPAPLEWKALAGTISTLWRQGTLDVIAVTAFIRDQFSKTPTLLESDWVSFGLTIGEKN